MKLNDGEHHICAECLQLIKLTCPYHSHGQEIDGMVYIERWRRYGNSRNIRACPEFIDDTECLRCRLKDACNCPGILGSDCTMFTRVERKLKNEQ